MSTATAIAKREFKTFFNSPMAYIVLGVLLFAIGLAYFFFSSLFLGHVASLRDFFRVAPFFFAIFVPAITMRLMAEERKSGTLELLLTMPVEDWQVVGGKFLAGWAMLGVAVLCTIPYALTVSALTAKGASLDWGSTAAGYFGLLLLAASFVAVGLWASSISRNQIVGFIVALLICQALYWIDSLAIVLQQYVPDAFVGVLQFLSVDYHFTNIARGVIDSRDVIFYLSLTATGLLLAWRSIAGARR